MARQYGSEELLRLRQSPLVCKPPHLPPVEEWMGPPPDTVHKRSTNIRGRHDGSLSYGEGQLSRPLLEGRSFTKGSSNAPGDIILGPPKTSFAFSSTSRTINSSFGAFCAESSNGDYISKVRYNGDREKSEGYEGRSRDQRLGTPRTGKEEGSDRSGRAPGVDEERGNRKNGGHENDHEITDARDKKKVQHKYSDIEDNTRPIGGRGSRPSWHRNEDAGETFSRDAAGDDTRTREWRDVERGTRRGLDRDWNRGAKIEQEPEWMADSKGEEKKDRHNAEDVEQFKAIMKAREMASAQGGSGIVTTHARTTSGNVGGKNKADPPLSVDPTLDDKFFHFWNDSNSGGVVTAKSVENPPNSKIGRNNAAKSSKFTGFFSPQTAAAPAELYQDQSTPSTVPPPAPPSEPINEDKAGFQRILKMLAKPPGFPDSPAKAAMGSHDMDYTHAGTPPELLSVDTSQSPPPILSPRSRKAHDLENLLGMQSPKEASASANPDSEFLLNLLRTRDQEIFQPMGGPHNSLGGNGQGSFSSDLTRGTQQAPPRVVDEIPTAGFYEDISHDITRTHEKSNVTFGRPQRQHIPFNENDEGSVFPPQFTMGVPSHLARPPGLQRPPGLDQTQPPPGFPQYFQQPQQPQFPQQQQQQQHHHHQQPVVQRNTNTIAPPPGFLNDTRNPNTGQLPPGLISNMGNLGISSERVPPFGMRHPGPRPGPGPSVGYAAPADMPPPGFNGISGPQPPGFPMMGRPPELYFSGARTSLELYPELGHFSGEGGPPGLHPGQYRRPE